jgi:hypothetical protein
MPSAFRKARTECSLGQDWSILQRLPALRAPYVVGQRPYPVNGYRRDRSPNLTPTTPSMFFLAPLRMKFGGNVLRIPKYLVLLCGIHLLAGCPDIEPPCSPETCSGCCMGGVCQAGVTTTGCGNGGTECVQCGTGFICGAEQQCVANQPGTCDASNCAGCCIGSTCVEAPTKSACGIGGAACTQCAANNICNTEGQCVLNPLSKWRVSAIRAELTERDINAEEWDTIDGSAPDVFVLLHCPPSNSPNSAQTPDVESYYPEWTTLGCTATAQDLLTEPIQIIAYDYDPPPLSDDLAAEFSLRLTADTLSDQREISIQPIQALNSMTLRITLAGP